MEQVVCAICSLPTSKARASMDRRMRSARMAASDGLISRATTKNSSPPHLTRVSLPRVASARIWATSTRTMSPAGMADFVVDRFEAIQVDHDEDDGRVSAVGMVAVGELPVDQLGLGRDVLHDVTTISKARQGIREAGLGQLLVALDELRRVQPDLFLQSLCVLGLSLLLAPLGPENGRQHHHQNQCVAAIGPTTSSTREA